jgi:O-antigen ligase
VLRRFVSTPLFAFADLILVILSGCLWMLRPELGILPVLAIALTPWVLRSIVGLFPFQRTALDWLVLLFLVTAWLGYWAAYDQQTAWSKIWFIFLAVLLYYALAGQREENRERVGILFFCLGVGVSTYFFLTLDVGLGSQWGWTPIHQNYVAGIAAITTPFILSPVRRSAERNKSLSTFRRVFIVLGSGITLLAVILASSRGIIMAVASVCGAWLIWQILDRTHKWPWLRNAAVFPSLILIYLCAVILFLYMGPASLGYASAHSAYSTGSRAELFAHGLYLVSDFPITGGGLGTFPGLYSYYMLGIPFFNVINSHNLFLDVAIEQGLLGGLSFLIIFLISIWFVAKNIVSTDSPRGRLFGWLTLSALIIAFVHGMVDDYLYNGSGTMLALALAGLSSGTQPRSARTADRKNHRILVFIPLTLILFVILINRNGFRAAWFADFGAVQMAKVELAGFPTGKWTEPEIALELEEANITLLSAIQADPMNRTANHRLGLISMLHGDFLSASAYLEKAHASAPNHRGIIKSLGYCYVWLGDVDKALPLLRSIPEAKGELDVYVWWWDTQGRHDLSVNAFQQSAQLKAQKDQP